jgi:hypothetical protein
MPIVAKTEQNQIEARRVSACRIFKERLQRFLVIGGSLVSRFPMGLDGVDLILRNRGVAEESPFRKRVVALIVVMRHEALIPEKHSHV